MPENTKLTLGVYHPLDTAGHILLLFTISIFFEIIYMSLSLFLFLLGIVLAGSFKNIPEFFEPVKFFLMLKIFLSL